VFDRQRFLNGRDLVKKRFFIPAVIIATVLAAFLSGCGGDYLIGGFASGL